MRYRRFTGTGKFGEAGTSRTWWKVGTSKPLVGHWDISTQRLISSQKSRPSSQVHSFLKRVPLAVIYLRSFFSAVKELLFAFAWDFLRRSGVDFFVLHWLQTGRRMAVDIPPAFGWVVLVAVAYCALNFWMAVQVGKARKRYNVPYPTLYASESENKNAKLFNCFQRGHQNSLESMPMFFLLIILGGLQHPVAAAILGVIYCLARYAYFAGYSSGDPARRLTYGKYNFPALMGLMVCAASFGLQLLLGGKKLASQA